MTDTPSWRVKAILVVIRARVLEREYESISRINGLEVRCQKVSKHKVQWRVSGLKVRNLSMLMWMLKENAQ